MCLCFFFFFRQGFIGAPATTGGSEKKQQFPLLARSLRGAELVLYMGVGVCPGVGSEAWFRSFAHPSSGVVGRGHAQYPAFAPHTLHLLLALQKGQLSYFWSFVFLVQNLPQLCMHEVIFSPA